jgi:hypothetical protein
MGRPATYSDEERTAFISLAAEVGVPLAIRELGYPSPRHARTWLEEAGVEYPQSPLAAYASTLSLLYGVKEKAAFFQAVIDKAYELLNIS